MSIVEQEETIEKPKAKFQVIRGGLDDGTVSTDWLKDMPVGQWFICQKMPEMDTQLWMVKFHFKTVTLLYTNLNLDYRLLVRSHDFCKRNILLEKLDIEETNG